MSVVEDVRQVIQDFLAPELRAISARLDAQDKVIDARFNEVLARIQALQNIVTLNDLEQRQALAKMYQDFQFDKRLTGIEQEIQRGKSSAA